MPYKLSGTYFAKRISTAKTFDDVQLAVKAYNDFLMARWLYYTDFFKSDKSKMAGESVLNTLTIL